jgi:hypothetical protein
VFVVSGAYYWWRKRVGFRNDYCLSCAAERRAVCIRSFDVGHIFWIPLLPVGFWKHWYCPVCGSDPHARPRTRPIFKWAGVLILISLALLSWIEPMTAGDEAVTWAFRLGAPLGAVLLIVHLMRSPKEDSLKKKLAAIQPASDTICPFCDVPMICGDRWSCPTCGVARY